MCIRDSNVVVHGIPSKNVIVREGDIVSIDIGATYEGFVGDNAFTFPCGKVSAEAEALMKATQESLYEGIKAAQAGNRVGDIGSAVQRYVEARGYSVVRTFVGHGVGAVSYTHLDVYKRQGKRRTGKVMAVSPKEGKVIIEGINKVKKHVKPRKMGEQGGIVEAEAAVYSSKVQIVCPRCGKPTRVGHKIYEDGKKGRICKKCGETLDA